MADRVLLARLGRARGIKGEIYADLIGTSPERFAPGLQVVLVRNETEKAALVDSAWMHNGRLILKFHGTEDRTGAEQLQLFSVYIDESDRPPAPAGEYYLSDLVGCRVETTAGRHLGQVTAWYENGASPILEVTEGSRELLVPFVDAFYRTVDVAGRRIVVELPEGLEELNAK